jgi:ABC-type dipeptide/oligopeptide/nickel transport system permease component
MLGYLVHRILIMIPTLIAISVVIFTIINLPPGTISPLISPNSKALAKLPIWPRYISFRFNMVSTVPSGCNTSTGSPGFSKETWDIHLRITFQ